MERAQDNQSRMHLLMAAVTVAFAWMVGPFLVPVILGAVLAALVGPAQRRLGAFTRTGPGVSAVLATLIFSVGLLLPFVLLLTAGVRSAAQLVRDLTERNTGAGGVEQSLLGHPAVARVMDWLEANSSFDRGALKGHLADLLQQVGLKMGGFLGAALQQVPQLMVFLFIMLLALYFIMVDGERLGRWALRQSPFPEDATREILEAVKQTSALTLLSSVAVSAVQSLIVFVGMLLTGIPGAFVWFSVAFLMAFLPIVGASPISLGCTLYLLADGRVGAGVVMLVCLVLAGLSDNVVRTLVIRGGAAQHPLVLLLSIFGGLSMLGFPGLFIGPVLASLFMAVLQVYTKTLRPDAVSRPPTPAQVVPDPAASK
ncbi:MAG: AI-2E family transporter [Deltaproteobacteria bacterium]|nr:AI-2E family transporter [Deltaproteobacteria bacterium]